MLFPIDELLKEKNKPLCISKDTKLADALALMIERDYSQLPIVEENGELSGLISEESILRTYYFSNGNVPLLDLSVQHCQVYAYTIEPGSDIFEVLDLLQRTYSVIVIEDQKPVGIITSADTTYFFRNLTEGLILAEDVEMTLRQYIEAVYDTENTMNAALIRAFGMDRRDKTKPGKEYDQLSLGQHIQLITTEENWLKFESSFGPKTLFLPYTDQVRDIRNQLAHFRGQLEPVQYNVLVHIKEWFETRPKDILKQPDEQRVRVESSVVIKSDSKYAALTSWLTKQTQANNIRVSIEDIEKLINTELPSAARKHRSWWTNDLSSHTQSKVWLQAGWRVEEVDFALEEVVFRKTDDVLRQLFFAELLNELKQYRPSLTKAKRVSHRRTFTLGAGKRGISFVWFFPENGDFRVELYINTSDKIVNKRVFDRLVQEKETIERAIGEPLGWDRWDDDLASRITVARDGNLHVSQDEINQLKNWALHTTFMFVDVFRPRIRDLNLG